MNANPARPAPGPIIASVGARSVAGAILVVISTLAGLDIGLFAAAGRSAGACVSRFHDPATVVVAGAGLESADAAQARAREILSAIPGLRVANLDPSDCDPGIAEAMGARPSPDAEVRLLAVEGPSAGSATRLEAALRAQNLPARADDHRWPSSALARTVAAVVGAAAGSAILLCLAIGMICAWMTRREFTRNQTAIEILSTAGAEDGFIIRLFRARAWRLGLWAAALGTAASDAILGLWSRYGPRTALDALRPLTHQDGAWSLGWPVAACAIAALASGWAARAALRSLP
jgi:hypothetical protein